MDRRWTRIDVHYCPLRSIIVHMGNAGALSFVESLHGVIEALKAPDSKAQGKGVSPRPLGATKDRRRPNAGAIIRAPRYRTTFGVHSVFSLTQGGAPWGACPGLCYRSPSGTRPRSRYSRNDKPGGLRSQVTSQTHACSWPLKPPAARIPRSSPAANRRRRRRRTGRSRPVGRSARPTLRRRP